MRSGFACAFLALLLFTSCTMEPTHTEPLKTEGLINELIEKHGIPGISIAVIEEGKVSYNAGHGLRSNDSEAQVDTETVFSAASLSKPVFAYIVMKLVETGDFDLDKPLYEYLPYQDLEHDERYKQITGRMVLSHSSGLPNWRRGQLKIEFEPGDRYQYSGEGFVYLMRVIEHLQGKQINEIAQELVFEPLGMSRSSYVWEDRFESNFAPPHDFTGLTIPKRKRRSGNVAYSLQTTAADYARLMLAIMKAEGLTQQTIKAMLTEQIGITDWESLGWSLGWGVQQTAKGKAIWQWGDNGTYKAFTISYPGDKKGLVFLTNSETGMRMIPTLIKHVFDDDCPAFDMIDYPLEDRPDQALLKSILENGYDQAISGYLQRGTDHHDTTLINANRMGRIGNRLMREGRFDDAQKAYFSNVKAYASYNSYLRYADFCLRSGNHEEAKTYYQKASELRPENERLTTILTQLNPESIEANVVFKLRQLNHLYARHITVAGDFNGWNTITHPFVKKNGEWVCRLKLAPGRYQYKFVIDGVWTLDPENTLAELDDNENINSILVVDEDTSGQ